MITENRAKKITAFSILIFSTLAFGLNSFDVFSLFGLIAHDLSADVSSLGLISAAFTIGIGIFQIPGGIIAAKIGPARTASIGMIIIALAAILTGLSTSIQEIAIFRFILGGGLAFYFPSVIILAAESSRKGSEALAVGSVTGSNAAGGILGLIVWAILASVIGWRSSIISGSFLAIISAIALYFVMPRISTAAAFGAKADTERVPPAVEASPQILSENATSTARDQTANSARHLRRVLLDKPLIILGLLLLGSQVALEQTLAFMPFYLQSSLGVQISIAGLVASFTLLAALVGSPVVGFLYDKGLGFSRLVIIFGTLLLTGVSINLTGTLPAAVLSTLIVGFSGGGLFALFSNAGRERAARAAGEGIYPFKYATLSVNWIHCLAITGTFWAPLLFSFSALRSGYSTAWPTIGIVSFAIIMTFLFMARRKSIVGAKIISGKSDTKSSQ